MHDPDVVKIVLGVLNNDQVKNVFSPVTKQIGQDILDLYRHVIGDNLERIKVKLAEKRTGKPLPTATDFKRIVPLLQSASVQSDEVLQERWANLMDSAIDQTDGYMPSFGQTLSEMSAEEAQYLDRLWTFLSQPLDFTSEYPPAMWPVDQTKLIDIYDSEMPTGINAFEMQMRKDKMSEEQVAGYARLLHAQLIIEDLVRLGILGQMQRVEANDHYSLNGIPMPTKGGRTVLTLEYSLTHYGVNFIRAVTTKTAAPNTDIPATAKKNEFQFSGPQFGEKSGDSAGQ
jgi:Abortive infection alpha